MVATLDPDYSDFDFRISRPFGSEHLGHSEFLSPSRTYVLAALRDFKNGERIFYMTANDPPDWPGLTRDILAEQMAELNAGDFIKHGLAYWERPFRVDADWCAPGSLTDLGCRLLKNVEAGYACRLATGEISREDTRAYYANHLRHGDNKGMAALSKLRVPWLADLRQCIKPVRSGYMFLPITMQIDLTATRRVYLRPLRDRSLHRTEYDIVRRMDDPRMADILAAMVSFVVGGDYDESRDCWVWPHDDEPPFGDLEA